MQVKGKEINICVFASGAGSNARKIWDYFNNHPYIHLSLIISNKPNAPVLQMATLYNIPTATICRKDFLQPANLLKLLKHHAIDMIVLAGFLWLLPKELIASYPEKIINIHPSLLPKFGGKGMYGMNVHRAVKNSGEKESGITIHFVNEEYDKGSIIFQYSCPIETADTPETISKKVQALEHLHFPKVLEILANKILKEQP